MQAYRSAEDVAQIERPDPLVAGVGLLARSGRALVAVQIWCSVAGSASAGVQVGAPTSGSRPRKASITSPPRLGDQVVLRGSERPLPLRLRRPGCLAELMPDCRAPSHRSPRTSASPSTVAAGVLIPPWLIRAQTRPDTARPAARTDVCRSAGSSARLCPPERPAVHASVRPRLDPAGGRSRVRQASITTGSTTADRSPDSARPADHQSRSGSPQPSHALGRHATTTSGSLRIRLDTDCARFDRFRPRAPHGSPSDPAMRTTSSRVFARELRQLLFERADLLIRSTPGSPPHRHALLTCSNPRQLTTIVQHTQAPTTPLRRAGEEP